MYIYIFILKIKRFHLKTVGVNNSPTVGKYENFNGKTSLLICCLHGILYNNMLFYSKYK